MAARKEPRRWIEFALEPFPASIGSPSNTTIYRWSTRPLVGDLFIEGRIPVDGFEAIARHASSMSGEYHIDTASVVINDSDGLVRSLLADVTTQWFLNREGAFKLLSEAALAAGLEPRINFGGYCSDVQVLDHRKARLAFEDPLARYLDRTYPQYTLSDAYPFRFTEQAEIDATLHEDDPGFQIFLALRDQIIPVYYGPFIDSAVDPVTGIQRRKGMCPTFFMGYTFLTAGTGTVPNEPSPEQAIVMPGNEANWGGWGELMICLGEVDVPNVYASDLLPNPQRILFGSDRFGTDLLCPGHPAWPFATDYVMRNGFRCTVMYARGPVLWQHITGMCNIAVDVCGWKNSDGDAVDQAGFVYQSFLSEHVLAHDGAGYTSGPEAGLPLYDDGRAMFWTSKVQAWQAMTADRLGTAKGYLCSMALTEPITLRDWLSTWHVTFDAFTAKNAAGQLYPFSIDDLADPADGVAIRERMELVSLPAPKIAWDEIENEIHYTVGWDPEQQTPRTPTLILRNQTAIDALGSTRKPQAGLRKPPIRALLYTADDATASDVIGRRVMRLKEPPRYQALPVRTGGVDREIGEQVRVSHQDGIGPAGVGYLQQPMTILDHVYRGNGIVLTAFDTSRILLAASRWAGDAVPDYDSATPEQQAFYGFWADDDDTLGSADHPAAEWR
jgi:hypothetical protein